MSASDIERQRLVSLMMAHQMRRDMRQVRHHPLVQDVLRDVCLEWTEPVLDAELNCYFMSGITAEGSHAVTLSYTLEEDLNGPRIGIYAVARVLLAENNIIELDIEHTSAVASTVTCAEVA